MYALVSPNGCLSRPELHMISCHTRPTPQTGIRTKGSVIKSGLDFGPMVGNRPLLELSVGGDHRVNLL